METVIAFLTMSVAWCIFYLYKTFSNAHPAEIHVYFILMHLYFVAFLLSRRMYILKNEEKLKRILKTRKLKKQLKKMRRERTKNGNGSES